MRKSRQRLSKSGDDGGGDTRVPIPNTTVKTSSADDTWSESSWESRTSPGKRSRESPAEMLGSSFVWGDGEGGASDDDTGVGYLVGVRLRERRK